MLLNQKIKGKNECVYTLSGTGAGVSYIYIVSWPNIPNEKKIFFLSIPDLGNFNPVCICFVYLIHIYYKLQKKLLNSLDGMFV